jgi:hypothetical protein
MADRAELEKALAEGCGVLVNGYVETIMSPDPLPTDAANGRPVTGLVVRDPRGRLTRQGMELAIVQKGSVMFNGKLIDKIEGLPTDADLTRQEERLAEEQRNGLLAQEAAIQGQLARVGFGQAGGRQQQPPTPQSDQERAEFEAWKRERDQRRRQQEQGEQQPPAPQPPSEEVPTAEPAEEEEMGFRRKGRK